VTSRKSVSHIAVAGLLFQMTSLGCACINLRSGDSGCSLPCHEPRASAATVQVGGQVHQAGTMEISANGLTLQHAIMSAGGAREMAVAEASTSSDPDKDMLKKLVQLARDTGKYGFDQEVFQNEPELAKKVLPLTPEEIQAEITKREEGIAGVINELAASQTNKRLDSIRTVEEQIGQFEEVIRLYDQLPGYFPDGPKKSFEDSLEKANAEEQKLLGNVFQTSRIVRPIRGDYLVALERPSVDPPVTYYFPYDLVVGGAAGDIALRNGDLVNVVDLHTSGLIPPDGSPSAARNNVAIQGYVKAAGTVKQLSTVGGVTSSGPTIRSAQSVWVLARPAPTGHSQQIFVLPDHMISSNGAAAAAPTQEGDVYTYTILPQVPIVFESLLAHTLEVNKQQCLDRLHANRERCQKRCHRRLDCIRDELSNLCNQIPNPPIAGTGLF
jgi:hypothetical protein